MTNKAAQELGRLGGLAGKGSKKPRSPEAQARINAGLKRYHERKRQERTK